MENQLLWKRVVEHHILNREKNTWLRERSVEEMLSQLEEEIGEVRKALKGEGDVADEVGDLLRDVLNIIALLHMKGIREKEVLEKMLDKDVRRKPWLYWEERLTPAQQVEAWEGSKAREGK